MSLPDMEVVKQFGTAKSMHKDLIKEGSSSFLSHGVNLLENVGTTHEKKPSILALMHIEKRGNSVLLETLKVIKYIPEIKSEMK